MDLLISIYAAAGALFAGYVLGTLDKQPVGASYLVIFGCLYALLWPYYIFRLLLEVYRQAQARGRK